MIKAKEMEEWESRNRQMQGGEERGESGREESE